MYRAHESSSFLGLAIRAVRLERRSTELRELFQDLESRLSLGHTELADDVMA